MYRNTGECVTLEETEQIKKNMSGMDRKTTKEKETGEESDKREPGSWTSAVVISGDLYGARGRSHISNVPVIWMGWGWGRGGVSGGG